MSKLIVVYWTPLQGEEFLRKEMTGSFKDLMKEAESLKALPETYKVQVYGDDDELYEDWVNWSLKMEIDVDDSE